MSYNTDHLRTAGKITVYTTLLGVLIFATVFIFNLGEREIKLADAQSSTATTSVFVVNTPPMWTATTTELVESSVANPTNAGDTVSWVAIGTDTNAEDYWLLVCSTNNPASATPSGAPHCNGGTQWAVSASTTSGTLATAATTTLDGWSQDNVWYGFICDGNSVTPRCNSIATQGVDATNSSPFIVNHRPSFTLFSTPISGNPGQGVIFSATSSDPDGYGIQDQVRLFVCATPGFNAASTTCSGTTLASSSLAISDPTVAYTIATVVQDTDYPVYPYIVDWHGFQANGGAHGVAGTLTVNNVAPTLSGTDISLNGGTDILLTVEAGETTGRTLSFITSDANSCEAVGGGSADEIQNYNLSIYRTPTGNSSTTCNAGSPFDPNKCYPSGVAPTAWNLTCTASTTTCGGVQDPDMVWECTFPLWYVADPTGSTTASFYNTVDNWKAQVRAIDDDHATGTYSESSIGVHVVPLLAFSMGLTPSINYGSVEPGAISGSGILNGTTTISATGNVGLDKDVEGSSMCGTYSLATPCLPSATSTIPDGSQRFASAKVAFGSATPLSSTTPQEIELDVKKSTATSSQEFKSAYWGIQVPDTISLAGSYTGLNIVTAKVGEPEQWY